MTKPTLIRLGVGVTAALAVAATSFVACSAGLAHHKKAASPDEGGGGGAAAGSAEGSGGSESSDRDAGPPPSAMEWPPPAPSATAEIEGRFFSGDRTLFEAGRRIKSMLERHGYGDQGWYVIPSGFAVATRCERIDDNGRALGSHRFSTDILRDFSITGILRTLFAAPSGRFRVIVVAMTSDPSSITRDRDNHNGSTVEGFEHGGQPGVPDGLKTTRIDGYRGFIMFYEISKTGEVEPRIVTDGLTSQEHLVSSGLEVR